MAPKVTILKNVAVRGGTISNGKEGDAEKSFGHATFKFKGEDLPYKLPLGEYFREVINGKIISTTQIDPHGATCLAFIQAIMSIKKEDRPEINITFHVDETGKEVVDAIFGDNSKVDQFHNDYLERIRIELSEFKETAFKFETDYEIDDKLGGPWELFHNYKEEEACDL